MNNSTKLTSIEVKEIQTVFALEVQMYIYEQKQEKKGILWDKALEYYKVKVDNYIREPTQYPSSLFSKNPGITRGMLMSPTMTQSKELNGREIWRKACDGKRFIVNNLLKKWNHYTSEGQIPTGRVVQDILEEILHDVYMENVKDKDNHVKDSVLEYRERPHEWAAFLYHGPPAPHLYNRAISLPFQIIPVKKQNSNDTSEGHTSHGRKEQRQRAIDESTGEKKPAVDGEAALQQQELHLAETAMHTNMFDKLYNLEKDPQEKNQILTNYKNFMKKELETAGLLESKKRRRGSSNDDSDSSSNEE